MAGELFAELGPGATIKSGWSAIEQVALTTLLLDEARGGFGGTWEDALVVLRLAGYHALALPAAEAMIAAGVTGNIEGRGTIAAGCTGELAGGRFTGTVSGIPWGAGADYFVVPAPAGGSFVVETSAGALEVGMNMAGEPRDGLKLDGAAARMVDADVFALGALARVAQIAGALDAALAMSVAYANERQQFGRPLAKFQAVQQALATFACEAAAANCAGMGAAQAVTRGGGGFEIAAAKIRANLAVGIGTASAHQVHGAIGLTQEYGLHPLTRRLWSWRSEFGADQRWSGALGDDIVTAGADRFWADLTALDGA